MAAIADLVAVNAAGANVTFVALQGANGQAPAIWRADSLGGSPNLRPRFEFLTRPSGGKDARKAQLHLYVPWTSTNTTTGITSVVAQVPFHVDITLPTAVPDSTMADAVAFFASLMGQTLVKNSVKGGYAPV